MPMRRIFTIALKAAAQTQLLMVLGYFIFRIAGVESPLVSDTARTSLSIFLVVFITVGVSLLLDWLVERPTEWSLHDDRLSIRHRWPSQNMTLSLGDIESLSHAEDMLRIRAKIQGKGRTLAWRYLRPHQHAVAAEIESALREQADA